MATHEASPAQSINHEHTYKEQKGAEVGLVGNMTGGAIRYDGWASQFGSKSRR